MARFLGFYIGQMKESPRQAPRFVVDACPGRLDLGAREPGCDSCLSPASIDGSWVDHFTTVNLNCLVHKIKGLILIIEKMLSKSQSVIQHVGKQNRLILFPVCPVPQHRLGPCGNRCSAVSQQETGSHFQWRLVWASEYKRNAFISLHFVLGKFPGP